MMLFSACAGMLLADVNGGVPCYVGDTCSRAFEESGSSAQFNLGERVLVTDRATLPTIYNALYGTVKRLLL